MVGGRQLHSLCAERSQSASQSRFGSLSDIQSWGKKSRRTTKRTDKRKRERETRKKGKKRKKIRKEEGCKRTKETSYFACQDTPKERNRRDKESRKRKQKRDKKNGCCFAMFFLFCFFFSRYISFFSYQKRDSAIDPLWPPACPRRGNTPFQKEPTGRPAEIKKERKERKKEKNPAK